jgi:phage-related minor tail protein
MANKSYQVELRGNTKVYRAEFGRAITSNDHFTKSLKGLSQGASAIQGPMGGIASRISVVNSLFSSGNIAIAGFAAGVAGLTAATYKSLKVFDEYQRGQLKTEALIKSTGNAAGFTAKQLEEQASQVALNTLASVGGIVEAQNVLQTFKTISGETFKEATVLAQDMAAVFGGSAKDKALQLGKALESPKDGLNALKRSGVSFTQSEREMVSAMQDAGNVADAQSFILRKLRDQVGGAGNAEAGGLSGDIDTTSQRWSELLNSWAGTSGAAIAVSGWIKTIGNALKELRETIDPTVDSLEKRLAELQSKSEAGSKQRRRRGGGANSSVVKEEIEDLKQQILEAKAANDDVDAISELISQRAEKIAEIDAKMSTASTRKGAGQMGRGGSEKEQLEKQRTALEAEQNQYIDHYLKLQAAEQQHIETQTQIKADAQAETDKITAENQAKEDEKQAKIDDRNAKEIESLQNKFTSIHEAALAAEEKDIELENAKYERKVADLQRDIELAVENNLLTEEIAAGHKQAIEDLEREHQANIAGIKKEADEKLLEDEKKKNEKISEGYSYLMSAVGTYFDGMQGKQAAYARVAMALGGMLLDEKKRDAIQSIWTSTSEAAMGAYAAMASIPVVGPALGIAAKIAVYAAGGLAAAKVTGMAHDGMSSIPSEGTYLLDGGERVVQPEQNRDLSNFLKAQDSAKSGDNKDRVEVYNYAGVPIKYTTESDVVKIMVGQMSNQSSEARNGLHATSNVLPRGRS